jgi:hypothetical protein
MNIHLVIRKYTLSQFANTNYWGNFARLTDLPLSDDQFLKLIEFYSAVESYKNAAFSLVNHADGYAYRFVKSPNTLVVYNHYGILNPSAISKIIKNGPEFDEYRSKRDELFSILGWAISEERITTVETTFNEENFKYSIELATYQEIEALYNSAQKLESFLGN